MLRYIITVSLLITIGITPGVSATCAEVDSYNEPSDGPVGVKTNHNGEIATVCLNDSCNGIEIGRCDILPF